MSPEKQRIAIAEACGKTIPPYTIGEEYIDDPHWNSGYWESFAQFENGVVLYRLCKKEEVGENEWEETYAAKQFPDYLNDLNAMHEAEKVLTEEQRSIYCYHLLPDKEQAFEREDVWLGAHATAKEKAEAFLRTIGKWEQ